MMATFTVPNAGERRDPVHRVCPSGSFTATATWWGQWFLLFAAAGTESRTAEVPRSALHQQSPSPRSQCRGERVWKLVTGTEAEWRPQGWALAANNDKMQRCKGCNVHTGCMCTALKHTGAVLLSESRLSSVHISRKGEQAADGERQTGLGWGWGTGLGQRLWWLASWAEGWILALFKVQGVPTEGFSAGEGLGWISAQPMSSICASLWAKKSFSGKVRLTASPSSSLYVLFFSSQHLALAVADIMLTILFIYSLSLLN